MTSKTWTIIVLVVIVVLVVAYFLWGQNQSASPGTEQSQTTNPTPTPTSSGSAGAVRVRVLAPNGGETWLRGKQYNVRWDTAGLAPAPMVYRGLILFPSGITNPYFKSKKITGP